MNIFLKNLSMLREAMKTKGIDFYLIPSTDPHLGEYVPDHWRIIPWLTGFTGSAATLVISESFAGLWTDSRYFIQAEQQLKGSGFTLANPSSQGKSGYIDWIGENSIFGSKIGLDGRLFSVEQIRKLKGKLNVNQFKFDFSCDLISELWTERPAMPSSPAFDHEVSFCGKDRASKSEEVRKIMNNKGAGYQLLTSPDDIMWLLNIRGGDIEYSPVLISFAIVSEDQILLFIDENKIPLRLANEFDRLGIVILPYEETDGVLASLSEDTAILLNPSLTSYELYNSVPSGMKVIEEITIPSYLKSIKNKTEIKNLEKAHVRDGIALTKFFHWFENLPSSEHTSELSVSQKINSFRAEGEYFLCPSFSTIVAFNDHAALPHYSPTPDSDRIIGDHGILLIDSGGQYLDGTTDITRTIAIGKPSVNQKHDFTLVLKGLIELSSARFPSGTKGQQIDILARKALWDYGLNYGHGTGHGVGFCLNVHEGPQSISQGTGSNRPLEPGILISDEPAIYREAEYGIRTENLMICFEDEETEFGLFLKFDTVSLCYIDKTLIEVQMLERKEIEWLNAYHNVVYEKLSPYLSSEERLWLKDKTAAI